MIVIDEAVGVSPVSCFELALASQKGRLLLPYPAREWIELGRTPTVTELAVAVELPEEEVKELHCRARQPVSLETKVGDGDDTELLDLLAGDGVLPEEVVDAECLKGDLGDLLEQLPELQSRVLKMR